MAIHNSEIAETFARLADLLELEDANPFRVRAYRNASRTVGSHSRSMADMVQQGEDLSRLPGIGKDLAGKIETLVQTGRLPQLERVESRTPAELRDLMKVEGLGPKRVKRLYKEIGVRSIEDLKRAARNGRIRQLEGFGAKAEETILRHAKRFSERDQRVKLSVAQDIAVPLLGYLEKCEGVKQITIAGSYRRQKETVGDLDILVSAKKDSPVIDRFTEYEEVVEV
ncbi:MAG TPA: helix-hairpin-helix domain-containing protein, partial [Gammaproteobacteria bacterium]|nr:helix-hairpin-helix domain-containing protein [Gammaproteobacteria bacterium]